MTAEDRRRWDRRHRREPTGDDRPALPALFAAHAARFPEQGRALDLACGTGRASVWLAGRGLDVVGVDGSPVAVSVARALAARHGVSARCRFAVVDLDDGLPEGPPADLIHCHRFRDPRLDRAVAARLAPGGLLAIGVLSEVGVGPGEHRAPPGALDAAFGDLERLAGGEADGLAWLLARRP